MPTIEEILDDYKDDVREPSAWAKELGAIVALPGAIGCPWCRGWMQDRGSGTIGVCDKDASHLAQLLPWGG